MTENQQVERDFDNEELFKIIIEMLELKREITYNYLQRYLYETSRLERARDYYSSEDKTLKLSDYLKFLEIYWEMIRKGFVIPFSVNQRFVTSTDVNGYLSLKGRRFIENKSNLYEDLIQDNFADTDEPRQILINENIQEVRSVIGFYQEIKKIVDQVENLTDSEKIFLSQEIFSSKLKKLSILC